jgi:hypothetical protein
MRIGSLFAVASLFLMLALAVSGCSKDEACTRARLHAADSWKAVTEGAGKLKLEGGSAFDDLTKEKQADHAKQFGEIEKQSDMVFKSFAYEKITWKTAGPAREKTNTTWEAFFNKEKYPLFGGSLKAANGEYDAVKAACGSDE